jgi:hypothetical protein
MKIIEVNTPKQAQSFIDLPKFIYKSDPQWVCPLDIEIENVFDPTKNSFYSHGEAIRFLLIDENGQPIGRVAAFINTNKAFTGEKPTGGLGFFECINNKEAAFLLFNSCKSWLSAKGMRAMDGPINFGENDNYWGLLTEGFVQPGYGMPYNPPYYQEFFESYGFKVKYSQITKHLDIHKSLTNRFWNIADRVRQKPGFTFEHFDMSRVDKFLNDFKTIYDDAWQFHEGFTPIELATLKRTFINARSIIDPELIWFAYFEGKPVAFEVTFPDINQLLKPFKGRLNLIHKIKLFWGLKTHKITRARIIIMGVAPAFQKHGLESAIFWHMNEMMKKKPWYKELEMSWVGDFNPKMRAIQDAVGGVFGKKHITYNISFE